MSTGFPVSFPLREWCCRLSATTTPRCRISQADSSAFIELAGFARFLAHLHLDPLDLNQQATAHVIEFTLSLRSYHSSPKACLMLLKGQGKTMELALRIIIKPFVGLLNDLSNMPSTSTFVEPRVSTSIAGLAACTTLWLHQG